MATAYAQPSLELPSSSSRQDIISALISEYGSFGDDDASIYSGDSPISSAKELPPLPPPKTPEKERKYSNDRSLPYGGRLSMRFQLRVDEPASPQTPIESRSPRESQPKRINYRSITRDSKPPSLNLLVSNGSTAKVPSTPILTPGTSTSTTSGRTPRADKDLPPPPAPSEISERRTQPTPSEDPKSPRRRERKDSQQSKEEKAPAADPVKRKPLPPKFTSLLDMKNMPRGGKGGPLPMPRSRTQDQTPELRQQDANRDRPSTAVETRTKKLPESPVEPVKARSVVAVANRLPPTPVQDDEMISKVAPLPPPPPAKPTKKPFAGMGLPSNPRAKHTKGKSSTGFDWMKGSKSESSQPAATSTQSPPAQTELQVPTQASTSVLSPVPSIITPGPTPTPKSAQPSQQLRDTASPMGDDASRRPFSFEALPPPGPPKQQTERPQPTPTTVASSAVPTPKPLAAVVAASPSLASQSKTLPPPPQDAATSSFPPRSTSRVPAASANLSPDSSIPSNSKPSLAADQPQQQQQQQQSDRLLPSAFSSLPSQQRDIPISPLSVYSPTSPSGGNGSISPISFAGPTNLNTNMADITIPAPFSPSPSTSTATPTPQPPQNPADEKPFTPLTSQPLPTHAAPITAAHLSCYTQHAQSIWSKNEFQPQACMACPPPPPPPPAPGVVAAAPRERMWACTWCYLRICVRCAEALHTIPGRDLRVLVERRKVEGPYAAGANVAVARSGSPSSGKGGGGVMSMLVEEPEVEEEKVVRGGPAGGVEMPKRHDSGAGGGNVDASVNGDRGAEQLKENNPVPWKANEDRYGGLGYESEEDFS